MNLENQISGNATLPAYTEEHLSRLDTGALIDLVIGDDDRVPRNVIDACAGRGDDMVAALGVLLQRPWYEGDEEGETPGRWWVKLHAVMILGLIAQENAGRLLVAFMRRMSEEDDDDLQGWLAGFRG